MTVEKIAGITGAQVVAAGRLAREATGCMVSDVMSGVIARGFSGMVFLTNTASINALAVAVMKDAACLVLAGGARLTEEALARAQKEQVTVLCSERSAFELAGMLYAAGLRGGEENERNAEP